MLISYATSDQKPMSPIYKEYGLSKLRFLLIAATAMLLAPSLFAADAPNLQNTVERYDPGKTASEIAEPDLEQSSQPPPNVVDVKRPPAAPKQSDSVTNIKFLLKRIILVGNTVFTTEQLSKLYADKLNTEVSLADLDAIAQKITEHYRTAGYILSQAIIPPQEIANGIVRIKVIEGYVSKVSVTGCKNHNVCKAISDYGNHIAKHTPLNLADLERYSFLANDIPGAKVRAVLSKSQDYAGAADLTFIVEEKNYGGSAAYNNYNSEVLGRQQVIGNAYLNNLSYASATAISGITTTNGDMNYIAFSHKQQLNSNGLGGNVSISNIHTTPNMGTIGLGGLEIPGKAFIANLGLDYSWIRTHKRNFYVGGGFKFLNSTTEFGDETLFKDNIRSINVHATYDYMYSVRTNNSLTLSLVQGLNILDAQGNPPSRVGEDLTFTKVELSGTSLHRFPNKFSSLLAFKGQYAFNLVPSSETFAYGGVPFGYGYDQSEFTGDRGIAGLAELRYQTWTIPSYKLYSHVFGYFDIGYVWDINNVQPTSQYGASTGLGTRMNLMRHVNFDFIIGVPLKSSTIEGTPNFVRILFNLKIYA